MTKEHSNKNKLTKQTPEKCNGGYNWSNDPFSDKFPWESHSPGYLENARKREEKKTGNNGKKGRAENI